MSKKKKIIYGMIHGEDIDIMMDELDAREFDKVAGNILRYIWRACECGTCDMEEMTPAGDYAYRSITKKISKNVDNARAKYGAPKGNKNAQRKDKNDKIDDAKAMRDAGLSFRQIGKELDVPPSTVKGWLKDDKEPEKDTELNSDANNAMSGILYGD